MRVLLIEDDSIQAKRLASVIQKKFGVAVDRIATELEFQQKLPEIQDGFYAVALVDMMLRWTDPSPDMVPPPQEVINEGFFYGGLRCRKALLAKNIESIIFTVFGSDTLPELKNEGIVFVQKGPSYQPVLKRLKDYLNPTTGVRQPSPKSDQA